MVVGGGTPSSPGWGGGYPIQSWPGWGMYSIHSWWLRYTPSSPDWGQTENITFPHPSDAGGKNAKILVTCFGGHKFELLWLMNVVAYCVKKSKEEKVIIGAAGLRSFKPFINQAVAAIHCCDVFVLSKNDRSSTGICWCTEDLNISLFFLCRAVSGTILRPSRNRTLTGTCCCY